MLPPVHRLRTKLIAWKSIQAGSECVLEYVLLEIFYYRYSNPPLANVPPLLARVHLLGESILCLVQKNRPIKGGVLMIAQEPRALPVPQNLEEAVELVIQSINETGTIRRGSSL